MRRDRNTSCGLETTVLRTSDLDYDLPQRLIATVPAEPREAARLMVVDRASGTIREHASVRDLPSFLVPGDLMVFNATRVLRARFVGTRVDTGGSVEGLYLGPADQGLWRVLLRAKRPREGRRIRIQGRDHAEQIELELVAPGVEAGEWIVRPLDALGNPVLEPAALVLERIGLTPLPPYILKARQVPMPLSPEGSASIAGGYAPGSVAQRDSTPEGSAKGGSSVNGGPLRGPTGQCVLPGAAPPAIDVQASGLEGNEGIDRRELELRLTDDLDRLRYQTVYAQAGASGSVAAPTAGLHFTAQMLGQLDAMGVGRAEVVLHVGTGTFRTVETEFVEQHPMHEEWCSMSAAAIAAVVRAKAQGRRVVAVGTTAARTLEAYAEHLAATGQSPEFLSTRILITPGRPWRWVDGLLTNFHLPRSTLMAMVAALLPGEVPTLKALYAQAIAREYRFYSFGDAMLVL